ncbi:hypothetical protein BE21_50370 [Sorangium cellulosum]|uniref:Secreted protein n=1 Tax=Sorangium cellulosum TaxID=56 RepID=A0A150TGC4_SORCE|nr:hypothetical protein BE21_50370 [Sorangium cellulosum]
MNLRSARLALAASSALCLATSAASALDTSAPSAPAGTIPTNPALLKTMVIGNHLRLEVLGGNLLTTNADNLRELTQRPLASASFAEGSLHKALLDPHARDVMQVLVECALRPDQGLSWTTTASELSAVDAGATVSSAESDLSWAIPLGEKPSLAPVVVAWSGDLGLCPSWAHGAPSTECQQLVSACLLARNNARGAHVDLSLRWAPLPEEDPPGAPSDERITPIDERMIPNAENAYPLQEGAFFGNLLDPEKLNTDAEVRLEKTFVKGTTLDKSKPVYRIVRPPLEEVEFVYEDAFACSPPDPLSYLMWVDQRLRMESRTCAMSGEFSRGCVARNAGSCAGEPYSPEPPLPVCEIGHGNYAACYSEQAAWLHPITVFLKDPCELSDCSNPLPINFEWRYIDYLEDPFSYRWEGTLPDDPFVDLPWNERIVPGALDPGELAELGAPQGLGGQGSLPSNP